MKKVLVTGASRGIGRSIALKLADEYELYLICRNRSDLMSDLPGKHYTGDVGDLTFIEEVFKDIGAPDLVINNAGIAHFDVIQDISPEKWNDILTTNLTAVYNTSYFAAKKMIPRHSGRIINISSIWGLYGGACESAYSASKGGVNAFTKALAKEFAPSGIAVNALAPGVVDTDMNSRLSEQERSELIEQIPAGRMVSPDEVAEAVILLSKMPVYLTGQIIAMDGGMI
ncbi:MAG: SDR family NAD(P)-dependent oxidoreductase [Lachnospiraceae bacterium]|nr:SDR family NAD(P)-dependent oxidoreductase [Lachnospiraceae bacterium]